MQQFDDLGLAEARLRALSAEGYKAPTPVQAEVIPAMLAGGDILAIAQTGTGKTAAFVLPLLEHADRQRAPAEARSCRALILAPTRELAAQIVESVRCYGRFTRCSCALIVGGVNPAPQIRALAKGVDILVATPGRLLDHLAAGAVRLDKTRKIVLDEADQMLDLGFIPAIRRIMAKVPADRQTILLSATMPKAIQALADSFLSSPTRIAVAPAAKPIERIDQQAMHVAGPAKGRILVELLAGADVERAIVFTRTKRGTDRINLHLRRAGLSTEALHGNKTQGQRHRALAAFRSGEVKILVATDIAARGLDVDDVSHVINFELPNVPEAYVHRIGRTARAGKEGKAISLYDDDERPLLRDIERLIGRALDPSAAASPADAPASRKPGKPRRSDARRTSQAAPRRFSRDRKPGRVSASAVHASR